MNINLHNISAIKVRLNQEIESENIDAAESLSQELCDVQCLNTDINMPENFVNQIKNKNKEIKIMSIRKNLVKAAVLVVVLSISAVTVHAGIVHFKNRNTYTFDYGIIVGNKSADANDDSSAVDTTVFTQSDSEASHNVSSMSDNEKIVLISSENGDDTVLWTKKDVSRMYYTVQSSDDAVSWKPDTQITDITAYTYNNYKVACDDNSIDNLFSTIYEQEGNTVYSEYTAYDSEDITQSNVPDKSAVINTDFKYKRGTFTIAQSKWLNSVDDDSNSIVVLSSDGVLNQRKYVSKSGIVFNLCDDTEFGYVRTSTVISYNNYEIIMSFRNLSEDDIHSILDTVIIAK